MPQRCRICAHPEIKAIESGLRNEISISELARRFDLTRYALMRHRAEHLSGVPLKRPRRDPALRGRLRIDRRAAGNRPPPPPEVEMTAKEQFLTEYATSGDFLGSSAIAGVSRATIQVWLEHDEDFSMRFHQAKAAVVDQLEATALDRAMHGAKLVREVWRGDRLIERVIEWRPQEMTVLKLLQALKPEVYAEKLQVTQTQIVKTVDADAWAAI